MFLPKIYAVNTNNSTKLFLQRSGGLAPITRTISKVRLAHFVFALFYTFSFHCASI